MSSRVAAFFMLLTLAAFQASGQSEDTLDEWVAANTAPAERLICKRAVNGEYFFVARASDDRFRLGSRLDMSEYRETHSFVIGWRLRNEHGEFITAKVTPTRLKADYVSSGGRTYADNVQYQNIKLGSKTLQVELEIEKCPFRSCDTTEGEAAKKTYILAICETAL